MTIGMTIVNLRSLAICRKYTFPFIWKLQNHAFVRSISGGLSAVREIANIAYSAEGDCFRYDDLRNPLSRKITAAYECETINIGADPRYDISFRC